MTNQPLQFAISLPRPQPHGTLDHITRIPGMTKNMALRLIARWFIGLPEPVRWTLASAPAPAEALDPSHWAIRSLSQAVGFHGGMLMHVLGKRPRVAGMVGVSPTDDRVIRAAFKGQESLLAPTMSRGIWTALCLNLPGRDVLVDLLADIDRLHQGDARSWLSRQEPTTTLSADDQVLIQTSAQIPPGWICKVRGFHAGGHSLVADAAARSGALQAALAQSPIVDLSAMFNAPMLLGPDDVVLTDADEPPARYAEG